MNADQVGGIVRTVIVSLGTVLAAKGYGDAATWQMIAGAVVVLGTAAWSLYTNRPGKVIPPKA